MGSDTGASQCDSPAEGSGMYVFQAPFDVCFQTNMEDLSLVGMPHLEVEVSVLDKHGRSDLGGYAVVHVPAAPGLHELSCRVWRPRGSKGDRFAAFFVGGYPQLRDASLCYGLKEEGDGEVGTRLTRSAAGQRMATAPCGEVHMRLSVCCKSGGSGDDDAINDGAAED